MTQWIGSRYAGWAAIMSGVLNLVGFVFLLLFFALEAPQILQNAEPSTPPLFGTLNDATFILVALCLVPVALALHSQAEAQAPIWSRITLAMGLVAFLAIAVVQALYVPRVISTAQQSPLLTVGLGAMGVWLILANWLALRSKTLILRLSWLGMAVGVCLLLMPVSYFAAGGSAVVNDPNAGMANPLVIVGFVLGMLGLGLGFSVWAILVGRQLLRRSDLAGATRLERSQGRAGA